MCYVRVLVKTGQPQSTCQYSYTCSRVAELCPDSAIYGYFQLPWQPTCPNSVPELESFRKFSTSRPRLLTYHIMVYILTLGCISSALKETYIKKPDSPSAGRAHNPNMAGNSKSVSHGNEEISAIFIGINYFPLLCYLFVSFYVGTGDFMRFSDIPTLQINELHELWEPHPIREGKPLILAGTPYERELPYTMVRGTYVWKQARHGAQVYAAKGGNIYD